jgi:hypothetical protein
MKLSAKLLTFFRCSRIRQWQACGLLSGRLLQRRRRVPGRAGEGCPQEPEVHLEGHDPDDQRGRHDQAAMHGRHVG